MELRNGSGITLLLLLCFTTFYLQAEAVGLTIPSSGNKCVSDEIQTNVIVLADYFVLNYEGNVTISAKIISPNGNNIHHNENVTQGHFAFTTTESGNYVICFRIDGKHQEAGAAVVLDWKTGISAKDWDSVAKKEKIEGVQLEIRKLEMIVRAIHDYLIYFKKKEAMLREMSERTHAKVASLSIMSLGLCILVSTFQLWYLKRFFRKKKLI